MTPIKTVLGGDDVRAVVVDCGTYHIRVGSSGDDTPRAVIPSSVALHNIKPNADIEMKDATQQQDSPTDKPGKACIAGDVLINAPKRFRHITPVFDFEKQTIDWDAMQTCWQSGVDALQLSLDVPFLIVEPARMWNTENRAKALECAFEGLGVSAAFLARGSAMAAFASARTSACVLDVGFYDSCAVPVVDGYAMQKSIVRSVVGGRFLSDRLRNWGEEILDGRLNYDGSERRMKRLRDDQVKKLDWIRAAHELKKERIENEEARRLYRITDLSNQGALANVTEAHRSFYRMRLIDDMKMCTFRISPTRLNKDGNVKEDAKNDGDEVKAKEVNSKESDLKSGKEAKYNKEGKESKSSKEKCVSERSTEYCLPDGNILSLEENSGTEIADMLFHTDEAKEMISVTDLAFRAVSAFDVDLRRDLFNSVVITGGSSMIPGLVERVTRELALLTPQAYKLKIYAPPNHIERTCASWIGGSIISNLGTFQQAWVSKAEYDELGSVNALRKCP